MAKKPKKYKPIAYVSSLDKKLLDSGRLLKDDRSALVESRTNMVRNQQSQHINNVINRMRELYGQRSPTPGDRKQFRSNLLPPTSSAASQKLGAIRKFTADDQASTWKSYGASTGYAKQKAISKLLDKGLKDWSAFAPGMGPAIKFPKPKPKTVFNRMLETNQKLRTGLETGVHKAVDAATNTNAAKNNPYVSSYLPGASKLTQPKAKPSVNPAVGQGYAGLGAVEMNKRKAQHEDMRMRAAAKTVEGYNRQKAMLNLLDSHGGDADFVMKHGQSVVESGIQAGKQAAAGYSSYSKWTKNKAKFENKPKRKPRKME